LDTYEEELKHDECVMDFNAGSVLEPSQVYLAAATEEDLSASKDEV